MSSHINLNHVVHCLKEYAKRRKDKTEVILLGALALHHYGMRGRGTVDLDAEVKGDVQNLTLYLKSKGIPSDLGEDISRWSLISLPKGYRKRAITLYQDQRLKIKVLAPLDLVIAKLRRFTEQDIQDAYYIAEKFKIKPQTLEKTKNEVIKSSPKDTILLNFERNVKFFIKNLVY